MYKLTTSGAVQRLSDGAFIPVDTGNVDYLDYQSWVSEGNLAIPADQPSAQELLNRLAIQYESRMSNIAAGYPQSERESWPVQMQEAQALLENPQASTPWIDAAAQARGLTRTELAERIAAKNAAYRIISGTLTGVRQAIEDQITAAGNDPQALAAIDVTAGWPAL
ncbi:MAG: hypothetical protein ACOY95_06610 [Pseudomonadota bacterium]